MTSLPVLETDRERADLLAALEQQRFFLRFTLRELDDERAALATTVSELTLAGLIKHVAHVEEQWVRFIEEGPAAFPPMNGPWDEAAMLARRQEFTMLPAESLAGLLEGYAVTAARTEQVVGALESLDVSHPLPEAPWFEPGAAWSARRVLLHVIAETAQHAGHADIIREALDGAKTMG